MRLPNPKEVERVVYYGERMRLRTIDATVRLSTWTTSVGAKAKMQKLGLELVIFLSISIRRGLLAMLACWWGFLWSWI
jgi:hypothetical protein